MKTQLALLEELQQHDARLQEKESTLKALPEKLQLKRNDLAKLEAILSRERQSLAETEKFRRDLEGQLKADESSMARSKSKLQQVKSSKDYMAAQRELEATRKIISEREDEILKLIEGIEAKKKAIGQAEKDVADLRTQFAAEERANEAKLAEIQTLVSSWRAERDEIAAKVNRDVLKRYSSIRLRRGLAVAPVVSGVCQGCHMSIPPQLYNLLQRGNTIETCPSCHRIIYWDQLMKDQELEKAES